LGHETVGLTEGEAVRISLLSAGLWWAIFTVVPLRRLRNRPTPNVPEGNVIAAGFDQLASTLAQVRRFPQTVRFLLAYLLYNDGIQTVIALAAVYIEKELLLDTSISVTVILLVQFVAFLGALALGRLAGHLGAQRVILLSLVVWTLVVVVAFVLPARSTAPLFALAAVIGFVLGGSQALSRSLFSQLIPKDKEAEYFSFYEISERGTSWLGTAAFAVAFEISGSYRVAIVILVFFFITGGLLLTRVRVREAIQAVGNEPPQIT
jgi:UMF1 family MFS transporter